MKHSVRKIISGGQTGADIAGIEDPLVTDGDKYSVVLENERVRVLKYHDKPGDKNLQHYHPDYVLYAESSFQAAIDIS